MIKTTKLEEGWVRLDVKCECGHEQSTVAKENSTPQMYCGCGAGEFYVSATTSKEE